jgi:lipopolysaccharide export system protein LptA
MEENQDFITLTGNVRAALTEKSGERRTVQMETRTLLYDHRTSLLRAPEEVRLVREEGTLTAGALEAQVSERRYHLTKGVRLETLHLPGEQTEPLPAPLVLTGGEGFGDLTTGELSVVDEPLLRMDQSSLRAVRFVAHLNEGRCRIFADQNVTGVLVRPGETVPTHFSCYRLTFWSDFHRALLVGSVRVRREERRMSCENLEAWLTPDLEDLVGAKATGKVRVRTPEGRLSAESLLANRPQQRIILTGSPSVEREGRTIEADLIACDWDLARFRFEGGVRGEELPTGPGGGRRTKEAHLSLGDEEVAVSSDSLVVVESARAVLLSGNARIRTAERDLRAPRILVEYAEEADGGRGIASLVAWPNVRIEGPQGLATAHTAVYLAAEDRYTLEGEARLWEGDRFLAARRITLWPKTRRVVAEGHVHGHFAEETREAEENPPASLPSEKDKLLFGTGRTVRFSSRAASLVPDEDWAALWGGVLLESETGESLRAERVFLRLDGAGEDDSRQLTAVLAYDRVQLTEQDRQAQGERLLYDLNAQLAFLAGSPAQAWEEQRGASGELLLMDRRHRRLLSFGGADFPAQGISASQETYLDAYTKSLTLPERSEP